MIKNEFEGVEPLGQAKRKMEKVRDLANLRDLVEEVFIRSTSSWTYQVMYHLINRKPWNSEVYAYGLGKHGLDPLKAVNMSGCQCENGRLVFDSSFEYKIKFVEKILKRTRSDEKEFSRLLHSIRHGVMIAMISGDRESMSDHQVEKDRLRKRLERFKEADLNPGRKIQEIAKDEHLKWVSLHSPLLQTVLEAIKRESREIFRSPIMLVPGLKRVVKEVSDYHKRKDRFFKVGVYKIREAIKQKGTLYEYFTEEDMEEIDVDTREDLSDRLSLITLLLVRLFGFKEGVTFSAVREVVRSRQQEEGVNKDLGKEYGLGWEDWRKYTLNELFESLHFENDFKKIKSVIGEDLSEEFRRVVYVEVADNQPMNRKKIIELSANLRKSKAVKAFMDEYDRRWQELVDV